MSNSWQPHGLYSPGILQARILQWVEYCQNSARILPFPSQGIFLTEESNWGLLHSRQILYQLSYKGSPTIQVNSIYVLKTMT